eukprot:14976-Heterococcus_DN1.PRE.1
MLSIAANRAVCSALAVAAAPRSVVAAVVNAVAVAHSQQTAACLNDAANSQPACSAQLARWCCVLVAAAAAAASSHWQ